MKNWEIHFYCADPDEFGWIPVSHGALGTEILSETSLRAFFSGSDEERRSFILHCEENGFQFLSSSKLVDTNWVQQCSDLMEPITVGAIQIVPVADAARVPREKQSGQIWLIPGAGFGTGHHITTEMMVSLLQHQCFKRQTIERVFDLGTGSGVLAIVANQLHPKAVIEAVDISEDALSNAQENATINTSATITFKKGSVESLQGEYDVIVSNLYAELLCSFHEDLYRHLKRGGYLLLSGIVQEQWSNINQVYSRALWERLEERHELGWHAVLLSKKQGD